MESKLRSKLAKLLSSVMSPPADEVGMCVAVVMLLLFEDGELGDEYTNSDQAADDDVFEVSMEKSCFRLREMGGSEINVDVLLIEDVIL